MCIMQAHYILIKITHPLSTAPAFNGSQQSWCVPAHAAILGIRAKNHRRAFCIYISRMCTWGKRLFISSCHFILRIKGCSSWPIHRHPTPLTTLWWPCSLPEPTGVPFPLVPSLISLPVRGRAMLGLSFHANIRDRRPGPQTYKGWGAKLHIIYIYIYNSTSCWPTWVTWGLTEPTRATLCQPPRENSSCPCIM